MITKMQIFRVIKKFRAILSKDQKFKIFQLLVLMIIGGFFETCSVSLIMPFMDLVMNSDNMMDKWYVRILDDVIQFDSDRQLLLVMSIFLALLYILKNIYLIFEYDVQYGFVYGNMFAMQSRLLDSFIHRPYEYFLKVNSGEIIRIVTSDTFDVFQVLITLLSVFSELVVSAMLILYIMIITPIVTLVIAGIMLVILAAIYLIVRPIIKRAATSQLEGAAGMNKWLLQSIHGIKELKVMNKEQFFQDSYDKYGYIYVQSRKKKDTLNMIARFMLEAFSLGTMFIIIAIMIYKGVNIQTIIPMLTAVAMSAVRLLPAMSRVSNGLTQIAYGEPMLDKMIENLKKFSADVDRAYNQIGTFGSEDDGHLSKLSGSIRLDGITYCYPESDVKVLERACMDIQCGDSVGIIGQSGAGKTTTVDILLGLLNFREGKITVDGADIHNRTREWHKQIGYIPQTIFMLDDTIRANVAFGEKEEDIDDEKVWKALEYASLDKFVKSLSGKIATEIGERGMRLSGGQRQRLGIARALYNEPEVLIFDEATSALDNDTESAIMESIYSLRGTKTMIIIAHRLTTIEGCDHVYRVENGKITRER